VEYTKRPFGLILLVLMILMGFEVGTKKPLCISSSIVNKIDRLASLSGGKAQALTTSAANFTSETLYNCSAFKVPAFSKFFYEEIDFLNARIKRVEGLSRLMGFKSQIEIVLDERTKNYIDLKKNVLVVSPDRLAGESFERFLMNAVLSANIKTENHQFIGFLSDWLTANNAEESVLAEVWNQSFSRLSLTEKFKVKSEIYNKIKNESNFLEVSMTENMLSLLSSDSLSVKNFKSSFQSNLESFGLIAGESHFDLVIQVAEGAKFNLKDMASQAKRFAPNRVLFQDSSGSYILPYLIKIEASRISDVRADLRVFIVKDESDKIEFNNFFANTDKLIVLNSKSSGEEINFKHLFAGNPARFLQSNKHYNFIQFHIPSLIYRLSELKGVSNFFSFLKEEKSSQLKEESLGWAAINWSKDVEAYKPVAVYDVIQYYRLN
jgi:hypothetical protein